MYFLNGDRIYIKPEKACGSLDEQFLNCVEQLKQLNSGKQIFKLNFFVDADSNEIYNNLKSEIRDKISKQLSNQIILNVIAQPPLSCKIIVEVFLYDPNLWKARLIKTDDNASAMLFGTNSYRPKSSRTSNKRTIGESSKRKRDYNN